MNKTELIENLAEKIMLGVLTKDEAEQTLIDNIELED